MRKITRNCGLQVLQTIDVVCVKKGKKRVKNKGKNSLTRGERSGILTERSREREKEKKLRKKVRENEKST